MSSQPPTEERLREVRFEHSRDFVNILRELGVALLVSTYQAGKVVVLGTTPNGLALSFHNFQQAMGCAVGASQLAIGSKTQIWFLQKADAVAAQLAPSLHHDACYLARTSHITDSIDIHEMQWCGDDLWFVNTRFSCLCTLGENFSFVPRWKPPFITTFAAEDRCHLNGLCVADGVPRYVTAMSETDTAEGWRAVKATGGCVLDVTAGEVIARGFAMPHSPRIHDGRLWVLDSGRGQLTTVEPATGKIEPVTQQPGYTRGLAFVGPFAFIGLSQIRETATFGGIPIAAEREQLKCAVAVVDLRSGKRVAYFEFLSGVEEIFDVQIISGTRNPYLSGPLADAEGGQPVWYAPTRQPLSARLQIPSPANTANTDSLFARAAVPDDARAAFRRGNELADDDKFDEALVYFERAIEICPTFGDAHCNLGLTLQYLGRIDDAKQRLTQALSIAPESPASHINLATTWFLAGELHRAWHEYEWRWKCARFKKRPQAATQIAPAWDGASLAGQTLLVYGEQGIGDEVMFASCLPELIEQSARCIVACQARLVPLFTRSLPAALILPVDALQRGDVQQRLGHVDFQIAAGSVPRFLRPTFASFPQQESYLLADPQRVQEFRGRLNVNGAALKVGISWKGGAIAEEQRRRSTTLDQWKTLFNQPNIDFITLQYGDCSEELRAAGERFGVQIQHWQDVDPLTDVDTFAAQIAALDVVITIDNSTLHFAGALGIPTLGLVSFPSSSAWRWFKEGEATPWYPSLRLLRRRYPAGWDSIFEQAAAHVAKLRGP